MAATGAGSRVDATLKLPQLQNFCKRDPQGYRADYDAQIRRLESELGILALQGTTTGCSSAANSSLLELMQFAAAVSSSSYKGSESDKIVNLFVHLLVGSSDDWSAVSSATNNKAGRATTTLDMTQVTTLSPSALHLDKHVRQTAVSALILMRNKGVVEPLRLFPLFFRLLAVVPDKGLRETLYRHMVNDVGNLNKKHQAQTVNKSLQAFLHRVVSTHGVASAEDDADCATNVAARRAVDLVCDLYRRRVWNDDRAVAIVASAVTSPNSTVMCRALRFFLNIEATMAEDSAKRVEAETDAKVRIDYHSHSKKTAARQRHTERQLKNRKKALKRKEEGEDWMESNVANDKGVEASKKLYPAIELLRDPHGLAEVILKRLRTPGSYKYEVKLLMMNFCTRLVGNHQLLLLPLYPFLTKYLTSHQRHVTQILAYAVQACHELVPPEEVLSLLKAIAHNFITERCTEEQMAVGINAARAICARVPSVLSEEDDPSGEEGGGVAWDAEAFARDLAAFGQHRDRSVAMAGKSWLNFVRDVHPALLQGKKSRGMKGSAGIKAGVKPLRYGEQKAATGVEGADLLVEYEAKKASRRKQQQQKDSIKQDSTASTGEEDDGWEEASSGSENSEMDEEWESTNDDELNEAGEDDEGAVDSESDDESAPNLVLVEKEDVEAVEHNSEGEEVPNVAKMSTKDRDKLKQQVSSTRIFSAADFDKMKKLVEREHRLKTDPREAARRKRAIAKGLEVDSLSSDDSSDSDDDDDDAIRIAGAVDPRDIMADAKRKRQSKAEKLEKIVAGRTKFASKQREGGSTNVEKKRKKNFMMSKFSREARSKSQVKGSLGKRKGTKKPLTHEAKKRRRKL